MAEEANSTMSLQQQNRRDITTYSSDEQPPPPPPPPPPIIHPSPSLQPPPLPTLANEQQQQPTPIAGPTKRPKTRHRVLNATATGIGRHLRKGSRVLGFRQSYGRAFNRYGSVNLSPTQRKMDEEEIQQNINNGSANQNMPGGRTDEQMDELNEESGRRRLSPSVRNAGTLNVGGGDGSIRLTVNDMSGRENAAAMTEDGLYRVRDEDVIKDAESLLRQVVIISISYVLGATVPDYLKYVRKLMELSCVAWGTCVIMIVVLWWKQRRLRRVMATHSARTAASARGILRRESSLQAYASQDQELAMQDEETPLLQSGSRDIATNQEEVKNLFPMDNEEPKRSPSITFGTSTTLTDDTPEISAQIQKDEESATSIAKGSFSRSGSLEETVPATTEETLQQQQEQPHPELNPLYVMDAIIDERITPNTYRTVKIDNDLFYGDLLMMFRTSDADMAELTAATTRGSKSNDAVSNYFREKQRRWEFQFQLKLKRLPTSPIYLGVEVDKPVKLGMVQKAFMGAVMNFVKKNNAGMSYCLSESFNARLIEEGKYEKAHIAFTLESSMDRFVATKPGEPVPKLGEPIYEDPALIKKRKKGDYVVDWNLEHTYTCGLWSAYIDYLQWKVLNIPGIRPISLDSVIGSQPLRMAVYCLKNNVNGNSSPKHYQCDMEKYVDIELSYEGKTVMGPSATTWLARDKGRTAPDISAQSLVAMEDVVDQNAARADVDEGSAAVDSAADFDGEDLVDDEETVAVEELGVGMYLKSGDKVVMREFLGEDNNSGDNGQNRDVFVANGGGFAVLQTYASSSLVIEKASNTRRGRHRSSKLIKSGDVVMIKLINGDDLKDVKYLSLHRGYWLKWVSRTPRNNGYFYIHTQETEGDIEMGGNETQTTYLTLGGSFSLRHRRWSRCVVGVSTERSVRFGGRVLGLHKVGKSTLIDDELAISDDEDETHPNNDFEGTDAASGKGKRKVLRPIFLCADIAASTIPGSPRRNSPLLSSLASFSQSDQIVEAEDTVGEVLQVQADSLKIDVPAWIEMMHRTKRQNQRAYIVRIIKNRPSETSNKPDDTGSEASLSAENKAVNANEEKPECYSSPQECESFIRIRTGEDLSPLLQLGLRLRGTSSASFETSRKDDSFSSADATKDEKFKFERDADPNDELVQGVAGDFNPSALESEISLKNDGYENSDLLIGEEKNSEIDYDVEASDAATKNVGKVNENDSYDTFEQETKGCHQIGDNALPTPPALSRDSSFSESVDHTQQSGNGDKKKKLKVSILNRKGRRSSIDICNSNNVSSDEKQTNIPDFKDDGITGLGSPKEKERTKKIMSEDKTGAANTTARSPLVDVEDGEDFVLNLNPSNIVESDEYDDQMDDDGQVVYSGDDDYDDQIDNDGQVVYSGDEGDDIGPARSPRRTKWKKVNRVAKSVKAGTAITGKQVVKHSKMVGKGTVTAGRAIISKSMVVQGKPPRKEPYRMMRLKSEKTSVKRRGKDHHLAVYRAMKSAAKKSDSLHAQTKIMAGQLSAPDQSCRTVSHVLSDMVSIPSASSSQINNMLTSQIAKAADLDSWFLRGSAVELGVIPQKSDADNLLHEFIVARCLWESHWREEWCGLCKSHISFYIPLSKKPFFMLSFRDMQTIRRINPQDSRNPLPTLSLLVLETAWRCHYLAFSDDGCRELFVGALNAAIFSSGENAVKSKDNAGDKDMLKAHFWEGVQTSADLSLSGGRGKWAPIYSSMKYKQRQILNGRRMTFDVESFFVQSRNPHKTQKDDLEGNQEKPEKSIGKVVEDMLIKALSFSLENLEKSPKDFVSFMDMTSRLRVLPIHMLDLNGKEAFCIFVNLYHCLLQHALLLSVGGPPNKRSVANFMRCSCYEIGGDVFSLAELQCCVIRGKMSSAVHAKLPYVEEPKGSHGHRFYALGTTDPRINFVLNNGDQSNLQSVPVLTPELLNSQLNESSSVFIERQLSIDSSRNSIVILLLPKICDVYRNDFGQGDITACLMFCLKFVDAKKQKEVIDLMSKEVNNVVIKYQPACDTFHSHLKLMT